MSDTSPLSEIRRLYEQHGAGMYAGELVTQLERDKYDRGFVVHMTPCDEMDQRVELRKLRRLLETLM